MLNRKKLKDEKAPQWAQELFSELIITAANYEHLRVHVAEIEMRLQRLPCWAKTAMVDCPESEPQTTMIEVENHVRR
jgi:hypothetical protein